jgi:superfamily II DNA/RNA helicase
MVKSGKSQRRSSVEGREERKERIAREIAALERRIEEESPARGFAPPLTQRVAFRALPLSGATLRGLEEAPFATMTAIQNACIPHALAGRDVLGAAKTGRCVVCFPRPSWCAVLPFPASI